VSFVASSPSGSLGFAALRPAGFFDVPRTPAWSRWAGGGFVRWSVVKPLVIFDARSLGGFYVVAPNKPAAVAAGAPRFAFRAGWPGRRARSFRFHVRPPGGSVRWRWLVWEGSGRVPARASLLRWLRGAFPAWRFG
jgi:hypothetical protein